MLAEKDKLTERHRLLLETTLEQLEASKNDKAELQNTVERLTEQLRKAGTKMSSKEEGTQTDEVVNQL